MSWWFWPLLGIIISEVAHIIVRVIRYNIMEREVMRYEHINVFLRIRTAENVDYQETWDFSHWASENLALCELVFGPKFFGILTPQDKFLLQSGESVLYKMLRNVDVVMTNKRRFYIHDSKKN